MKLSSITQILTGRRAEIACEACGSPFSCGAKLTGCWCTAINLSEETRTELKSRYRDCLCRQCLEKFSASTHLPVDNAQ